MADGRNHHRKARALRPEDHCLVYIVIVHESMHLVALINVYFTVETLAGFIIYTYISLTEHSKLPQALRLHYLHSTLPHR